MWIADGLRNATSAEVNVSTEIDPSSETTESVLTEWHGYRAQIKTRRLCIFSEFSTIQLTMPGELDRCHCPQRSGQFCWLFRSSILALLHDRSMPKHSSSCGYSDARHPMSRQSRHQATTVVFTAQPRAEEKAESTARGEQDDNACDIVFLATQSLGSRYIVREALVSDQLFG